MKFPILLKDKLFLITCSLGLTCTVSGVAERLDWTLRIEAADRDRAHLPVTAELALDGIDWNHTRTARLVGPDNESRPVQWEKDPGAGVLRLSWVEPGVPEGAAPEFSLSFNTGKSGEEEPPQFRFEYGEDFQDLFFGDKGVTRYVTVYDPDRHEDTHKPYHLVYDLSGQDFITKGPGGRFPHHKGIFLGWNQTRLENGDRYDFWHARREYLQHERYLPERETAGPVFARSASTTLWKKPDGEPAVRDTREATTWKLGPDTLLLDYLITIESVTGEIFLGGDAHHAGFQFRAAQEVVGNAGETTVISPEGAETLPNDLWGNLAWKAISFNVAGEPYTVLHMSHPDNPDDTVYSVRDYGRFGAFFTSPVNEGEPLVVRYRIMIKNGRGEEIASREILDAFYRNYAEPVAVQVVRQTAAD